VTAGGSLFRRHLIVSILITSVFVSSLGFLSLLMIRQFRKESATPFSSPAVIFAKFLHSIEKKKRPQALEEITDSESKSHFQFWLLSKNGEVLFPKSKDLLPIQWAQVSKPQRIFEFRNFDSPTSAVLIQIDDSPSEFLLVRFRGRPTGSKMFFINSFSLIIAVILGTTLSFFILFYSLRQKANLADTVISELQKGNLKARFPVTKMDEVGRAMLRFNRMADEIERLVERLKTTEKSRMLILQELAHDLRTPVASLKNMLETLLNKSEVMESSVRGELTSLSLKEVDYFEHLVEDLLFLAQATEPGYNLEAKLVKISRLIEEEAESAAKAKSPDGKNINIQLALDPAAELKGDPHLLRRLIRNAIDNATSYANKSVTVSARFENGQVQCVIQDDGPGFSEEALNEFGKRKLSRKYISTSQRRASIGLGSVIMSAVVSLHRGHMTVENRFDSKGEILGGEVKFTLPA
jgi:signal transduction histidine kinase